jgi:hypothetical protein
MQLTNKLNLPQPITDAVKGFDKNYQKGRGTAKLSVTQLISPPLIKHLADKHWDEMEEDVSDRIWTIVGSAVHGILEHSAGSNVLAEERLTQTVDGVTISGQADIYEEPGTLSDYKITSVWSVVGKQKIEWEQQLNCLAWLYRKAGFPTVKLQIVAILRDWSKRKAGREPDYPQSQVLLIVIPQWTDEACEKYIKERIVVHTSEPTRCTDDERWHKEDVYAVMKEGRQSAVKLCNTREEAEAVANEKGKHHSVVLRPGEDTRCEDYCNVEQFCPYREHKCESK